MFSANTTANALEIVPGAPTIGAAYSGGTSSGYVYFTPPASSGTSPITSYTAVAYAGSTPVSSNTIAAPGPGYIYVYGLSASTTYRMIVYATNSAGNSPYSAFSNYFTTDTPAPPPPFLISIDSAYSSWNLNVPYGSWRYLTVPVYCSSSSGYYTAQETSRPSAWTVSVNGVTGGPSGGLAVSNVFTYVGNTTYTTLGIFPATIGTFSGQFAFVNYPNQSNIYVNWTCVSRAS